MTVAAVGGLNVKAARFYGRIGGAYHRVRVDTAQATFPRAIPIDDVVTTYPSSAQSFVYETEGWGRLLGFGVEGWVTDSIAIFADASFMKIEGENADTGGERIMKDHVQSIMAGVKVHIGRHR